MTYKELYEDVLALGFESEAENEDRLILAARRALNMIFTERPLYKTLEIYQNEKTPLMTLPDFTHKGGEAICIDFSAKAYSFMTHGTGSFKITDESGERVFDFSLTKQHKGFLHGAGKIEFLGDYLYTVSDFAIYDELFGDKIEDIPTNSFFAEYKIISHAPDFLASTDAPRDRYGKIIEGASVGGGIMEIPARYSGFIRLEYKARAPIFSKEADSEIITPEGCEHLLPLLTAAYFWLDDDAEKAEYYMSLYREAMIAVKLYTRSRAKSTYSVTDGWA